MNDKQVQRDLPVPLARLDLYNEAIIMTRFGHRSNTSYPVSIYDLAAAFGTLPASSGFLPRNTLFHGRNRGQEFVGVFIPAQKQMVRVEETTMTIPLPPAIFIGCGKQYVIHALSSYPQSSRATLYRYPSPNVFLPSGDKACDGRICAGDTPFPTCSIKSIMPAFSLFIESKFNRHLVNQKCRSFPNNIIELWKTLDGQEQFPLSELIPSTANLRTWV